MPHIFSNKETTILLELARRAMADADIFDDLAGPHDMPDAELADLRERLQAAMDDTTGEMIMFNVREEGEALLPEAECAADYALSKDHQSCWITVDNIAVYVARQDEGVSVSLYPKGVADAESLSETWATFAEAQEIIAKESDRDLADADLFICATCKGTFDNDRG